MPFAADFKFLNFLTRHTILTDQIWKRPKHVRAWQERSVKHSKASDHEIAQQHARAINSFSAVIIAFLVFSLLSPYWWRLRIVSHRELLGKTEDIMFNNTNKEFVYVKSNTNANEIYDVRDRKSVV